MLMRAALSLLLAMVFCASVANAQVMREYIKGTIRAVVSTGQAEPAYLAAARKVS